ncbi:hypothetical protein LCGC14_1083590 [marine sediment metagenome]|uniref:Uncharacterized protein n=1 Tax=marine sediment metagenome TaxID=412755 RepID=A0A0F9MEN3_9ZZZZ
MIPQAVEIAERVIKQADDGHIWPVVAMALAVVLYLVYRDFMAPRLRMRKVLNGNGGGLRERDVLVQKFAADLHEITRALDLHIGQSDEFRKNFDKCMERISNDINGLHSRISTGRREMDEKIDRMQV